jgi:hypothetical protein
MDYEKAMSWSRQIRVLYALPSDAMLAAISSAAAFLSVAATLAVPKMEDHPWVLHFVIVPLMVIAGGSLLLLMAALVFRMYLEYSRRTYDISTIMPLVNRSESDAMESQFTLAAQRTLEIISKGGWKTVDHVTDVEPVLDFLEDVGLLLATDQVSDEIAHHYFFLMTYFYFAALKDYIRDRQASTYGKATWRYVEPLFERTFLIERGLDDEAPRQPPQNEIIEFLNQEAEKRPQI